MAVPDFQSVMLPFLEFLQDGQERTMREVTEALAERFKLTAEQRQEQLPSGPQPLFYNRVAWAKTHLKNAGLIDNPVRGKVSVSEAGRKVLLQKPPAVNCRFLKQFPSYLKFIGQTPGEGGGEQESVIESTQTPLELMDASFGTLRKATADDLLTRLKTCSPGFFEQVVVRLLRAMGYGGVTGDASVTGKPGDGGIDGIIKEDKLGLDVVCTLGAWFVRGDVDLIRLERSRDERLHALVADMKSTTEARVEHRLQVAFYHQMLDRILVDAGITGSAIQTGILFKPPADPTTEEAVEVIPPLREAAEKWFGLTGVLLEVVADPDAYLRSARDLVTGPDSTASRVAQAPFADVPFCLSFKCDGCLYNEWCMKDAAEREDLSLLPYMTGVEKEALRRAGVTTIQALASLKDFAGPNPGTPGQRADLVPAPGREPVVRRVAATWPVGPRLDELVHRARSFRRSVKKDGTPALGYIPDTGNSTLPASRPDLNPNLVRAYIDAQHDYLNDRVYLLGALVVGCRNGVPDPARRRAVVRMTDGPPETGAAERQLFVDWTRELVKAVVELAAPGEKKDGKNTAPVHVVFFDRYEQRLLLEGLTRPHGRLPGPHSRSSLRRVC